jgi:hypothetical protein
MPKKLSYYRVEGLSAQMYDAQAWVAQEERLEGYVRCCVTFAV